MFQNMLKCKKECAIIVSSLLKVEKCITKIISAKMILYEERGKKEMEENRIFIFL